MAFKLIGIDPGLAATGIGVITGQMQTVIDFAYGVIRTDQKSSTAVAERSHA